MSRILSLFVTVGLTGYSLSFAQTTGLQPSSVNLYAGETVQFSYPPATGASTVWSISPAGNGTISPTGLYRAPDGISVARNVTVSVSVLTVPARAYQATVNLRPLRVTVSPGSATLSVQGTRPFTASVTADAPQGVAWTVNPPTLGTVSPTGMYTAPPSIPNTQTVRVIATSLADPGKSDFATVTLDPLRLTIAPTRPTLTVGQTQAFTVTSPNGSASVAYSLEPAGRGTISSSGVYTAPSSIPNEVEVRVIARSTVDATREIVATVTLQPLRLTVTPATATLSFAETRQFTAAAQAGANNSVTWRLDPAGVGSLSATGLYTAPSSIPQETTVRAIATSTVDPNVTATATIRLTPLTLSIAPATGVALTVGQTRQFSVRGADATPPAVRWSVVAPGAGTISASGLYTTPSAIVANSTVEVRATSVADTSRFVSAVVNLVPLNLTAAPASATLRAGQTRQFAVNAANNGPESVTWRVEPVGAGTVTSTGLYTAPGVIGANTSVRLIATSTVDTNVTAIANVILQPSDITLSPTVVSLTVNETRQFTARVAGGGAVTWRLDPATGAGTISGTGLFTAPASIPVEAVVRVIATSVSDPTDVASALVTLTPLGLSLSPQTETLTVTQTAQFTARLNGQATTNVRWSATPSSGAGAISSTGLYTAPAAIAAARTITITATSTADASRSASSAIRLEPLDLRMSPVSVSLRSAATQQFNVSALLSGPTAVTWRLEPAIGSISASGLYTAPATVVTAATVRVIATSTVDSARSADATIQLRAADLDVAPSAVTLRAGRIVQFAARSSAGVPSAVNWTISPPNAGSITPAGLYTAPAVVSTATVVTVTAASVADASLFGTATVLLQTCTGICVTLTPETSTLTGGQTQQFLASVSSTTNTAVTWSLEPTVGTISTGGLYTAPATIAADQTVIVTATSVASPTRSDTAVVTLRAPVGPPFLSRISPNWGKPGQSFTIQVDLANTDLSPPVELSLGAGVAVGGGAAGAFGPASLVGSRTISAAVQIAPSTLGSLNSVQVRTGGRLVRLDDGFTVEVRAVQLGAVSPGVIYPGDAASTIALNTPDGGPANVSVTLVGSSGSLTIPATAGPSVAGSRRIDFILPNTITPGSYDLNLAASIGGTNITAPFPTGITVNARPRIASISPATLRSGEAVLVTLLLENFTVVPGLIEASFGDGLSVGGGSAGAFGPAEAGSGNSVRALVVASAGALSGPRSVRVRQGNQIVDLSAGFTLLPALPVVTLLEPAAGSFTNTSPATVRGSVSTPVSGLTVNGIPAQVSGTSFQAVVPLVEGDNLITAVATTPNGVSSGAVTVVLDTTPPRVALAWPPASSFVTTASTITISGMINDLVIGTVNDQQATVSLNNTTVPVANRRFVVADRPLALGDNQFTVIGRDRTGNSTTVNLSVRRDPVATPEIRMVSGNNQSGVVGGALSQPLVVRLVDAGGTPQPNKEIVAKVVEADGSLNPAGSVSSFTAGGLVRSVVRRTDNRGEASFQWTLGLRAGAGNNRVEITAPGFSGTASFIANALAGVPDRLLVDSGANQSGQVGKPLPFPLVAVVADSGLNRLANVPVTFTVVRGSGNFGGQRSITLSSDSDGRAQATLTLGWEARSGSNTVAVSFAGNPRKPIYFTANGLAPADPGATRISGVVLDNANQPIAGVTMRLFQPFLAASNNVPVPAAPAVVTGPQGQFTIQPAPIGRFKLMADGGTALPLGRWPTLEYDIVTIPGANNTVGMPIFLPLLDPANRLCVSETTGGTLTLPQVPGFSLTIQPGSATFPGGSRTGCVSVSSVHHDKVPMVPAMGNQPRFIVTIQPVGTQFNPPAAISMPNTDGWRPGQTVEFYSYDHDLSNFVSIGPGTITDDGRQVRSNPGVGVVKAGWHGGGAPPPDSDVEPAFVSLSPQEVWVPAGESRTVTASGSPAPPGGAGYTWELPASSAFQFQGPSGNPVLSVLAQDSGQGDPDAPNEFAVTYFSQEAEAPARANGRACSYKVEFRESAQANEPQGCTGFDEDSVTGSNPKKAALMAPEGSDNQVTVRASVSGRQCQVTDLRFATDPGGAATLTPEAPAQRDTPVQVRAAQPGAASFVVRLPNGSDADPKLRLDRKARRTRRFLIYRALDTAARNANVVVNAPNLTTIETLLRRTWLAQANVDVTVEDRGSVNIAYDTNNDGQIDYGFGPGTEADLLLQDIVRNTTNYRISGDDTIVFLTLPIAGSRANTTTLGFGVVGGNVAVVSGDLVGQAQAGVVTHEIGHNLGAQHVSRGPAGQQAEYIMNPNPRPDLTYGCRVAAVNWNQANQ